MNITNQLNRLIEVGLADLADLNSADLAAHAEQLPDEANALLAVHPSVVPAQQLATLLRHNGKPVFVVTDMTDLEQFLPITDVTVPNRPGSRPSCRLDPDRLGGAGVAHRCPCRAQ